MVVLCTTLSGHTENLCIISTKQLWESSMKTCALITLAYHSVGCPN